MTRHLPKSRIAIAAVALVIGALMFAWTAVESIRQQHQIDALAEALAAEQAAAEERGESPVAPAPEDLLEDPEAPAPEPIGPTDAQVLDAVRAYFAANPVEDGQDASPAQIAAAVINYLTEHPPEPGDPGPAPTADQIMAAVSAYLAENPPPAGPPGADGEDGRPPTAEEIEDALSVYLTEHPIEMCPSGSVAEAHEVLTTGGPVWAVICVEQEEN